MLLKKVCIFNQGKFCFNFWNLEALGSEVSSEVKDKITEKLTASKLKSDASSKKKEKKKKEAKKKKEKEAQENPEPSEDPVIPREKGGKIEKKKSKKKKEPSENLKITLKNLTWVQTNLPILFFDKKIHCRTFDKNFFVVD